MRSTISTLTCLMLVLALGACASPGAARHGDPAAIDAAAMDSAFAGLVRRNAINTAGVAVIRDGEIAWSGYYGEQSPGVPASRTTLFNVASITKVFTAETILRLADAGLLALDEPMAPHWVDPDVADDPRHALLTPRMALSHTTGFPNWRFLVPERKLGFLHDPGTTYGYSGEGYEYVATYAGKRLDADFGELVRTHLLEPLGIPGAAYGIREDTFDRLAQARDEDGRFHGHYCRPNGWCREPGTYSAADDMAIAVEDLARFLVAARDGEGYGASMRGERERVHVTLGDQAVVDCAMAAPGGCPREQGYGLGWQVLDYGDDRLLSHGGSDWSELALAYIHTRSGDGVVILFNAPGLEGLAAMPQALALVDPDSPLRGKYERWYRQAQREAGGADASAEDSVP
ncbi:beta-lactamase family protein [Luteimonas sp. SJ-92]|uniref:Beta-lactamase family protein n=1 Tax=Luteimonas salinisoli TaxID=2752307 RepID=A0A853J966_9GAMM|nr:serine hydrolase domain-containing protein [Luteimonas salinisoli]NZA25683.1 beta-lactamase family protein [Luteimonas salinisoli]